MAPVNKTIVQRIAIAGAQDFFSILGAIGTVGKQAFGAVQAGIQNASQAAQAMAPAIATLQKRVEDVNKAGNEFKNRFSEMTGLVHGLGTKLAEVVALAVPLSGGELLSQIIGGGKAASELEKVATGLGITSKSLQEMQYAAGQADVSSEEFAKGLGRLENKVSEAAKAHVELRNEQLKLQDELTKGTINDKQYNERLEALRVTASRSTDVFTRLGISITESDGSLRGVDVILHRLLEEWPQLTKAQQAAFASQLGFQRDRSMLNVLAQGAQGFDRLVQEGRKVAPVMTEAEKAVGIKLNEAVNKLTAAWMSMYNAARLAFAPLTAFAAEAFSENIGKIRARVLAWAQELAGTIRPIVVDFISLISGEDEHRINPNGFVGQLVGTLKQVKVTFIEVYGILKAGWDGIVAVMDVVASVINFIFGTHFSGQALAVIAVLGVISGAFSGIGTIIGVVTAGIAIFAAFFGVQFAFIEGVITAAGLLIGYFFGAQFKDKVLPALIEFFNALKEGWDATVQNFKNVWAFGIAFLKSEWQAFADWAMGYIQPLLNAINKIKQALGGSGASGAGASEGLTGGYADGGNVRGSGSGTSDSILARLSNGEFVVRAQAVSHYGSDFLNALNSMRLPGFALGGLVDALAPRVPRYSGGGMVGAAAVNNHPVILQIGDSKFGPMMAAEHTVSKLSRFAAGQQMRSGGRKPSWKSNS